MSKKFENLESMLEQLKSKPIVKEEKQKAKKEDKQKESKEENKKKKEK